MKIRFFNTFDTAAPFFKQLLPYLHGRGHEVEVLIASRTYRPGGLRPGSRGFRVRALPTLTFPGIRRLRLVTIHATYALSAAVVSIVSRHADVNVFLTQPPLFGIWGSVLHRARNQPYSVLIMDLYPWVAVAAGLLDPNGLSTRLATKLARRTLSRAQRVIVIGRCMAERVERLGIASHRIRTIHNWADPSTVQPVPPEVNRLRRQHGLHDRFVVMYSGNLGVSHYFEDLLEVAFRLRHHERIRFLFVGRGPRLAEVRSGVEKMGLRNVLFLDFQPYERLSESLSMGDIHFVSLREGFEGLVVPSKAYGALAAGRPLLYQGSASGEIARVVEEHDIGEVIPQGHPEDLEAAILRAEQDHDWRQAAGARARSLTETRYGPAAALSSYEAVITETARQPNNS